MNRTSFTVDDSRDIGMRVDRYVAEVRELFSRSQLKSREVEVQVNGNPVKWSHRLSLGDMVALSWPPESRTEVVPEAIDLDVIFESDDVVVLNKPQGMVVHPAAGNYSGTLVQGLAYRSTIGAETLSAENLRPGIVHRLDKDTSGVIITAKSAPAREFLANQFAKKHTAKVYVAIVKGVVFPRQGRIETFIRRDPKNRKRFIASEEEGKEAVTEYEVLKQWQRYAFVSLRPVTGRTHQLRVHLSSIGHPILGDPIYARPDPFLRNATLMLHAHRLRIMLPRRVADSTKPSGFHYEGGETVRFLAPLPVRFKSMIKLLSRGSLGPNT